jgi:hypothetical protein
MRLRYTGSEEDIAVLFCRESRVQPGAQDLRGLIFNVGRCLPINKLSLVSATKTPLQLVVRKSASWECCCPNSVWRQLFGYFQRV